MKQTQTARRNRKHYSASKIRNPKGKQHEPISVECQNIFLEGGLNTEDRISRTRNRHQLKPTQQCKTTPEGGQRPERKDSRRGGQGWNAVPRHACPLPLSMRACPPSAVTLHTCHSDNHGGMPAQGNPCHVQNCTPAVHPTHCRAYPASSQLLGAVQGHKRPQIRDVKWS